MYESGGSNFFSGIGSFNEPKYATSTDEEPARKKRCGLTPFSGLPTEQTQTSGTCDTLQNGDTFILITAPSEIVQESTLSSIANTKPANVSKQKKESGHGVAVSPAEEVLGSVTTFYPAGHPENGHTLRTSARVKHKMRMETIHNTPAHAERKEQTKPSGTALAKTPIQQKQMRVVWSNHDKNLFFEALNEYGKDFEAILNYLNTKKRRKDNGCEQQVFKTKDVRSLYYQFNQKISKYLHFSDEVKKEAQELYALINYGEMRKKMPFQNKKYFPKLKDLVYKGFTMVREKGKTIRIKTPSCRALRKLNQLEEWQQEIKLPPRVDVMLQPANMEAWGRVQSLAQNPRVRITVTIQKRVSALLQLFQQKWRPQELRLIERVKKMETVSATVTSKLMRQRMQNEIQFCSQIMPPAAIPSSASASSELVGQVVNFQLHFVPSHSAVIHRPLISLAEFQSNTSICLNSYEQRIGVKVRGETLALSEKSAGGTYKKSKLCPEVGHDATKDEKQVVEQMTKININEFLKSPNASNESIELKEMDCLDIELMNEHGARSGDDCDGLDGMEHTYGTVDTNTLPATVGSDPVVARMSDNSNDEFALQSESVPLQYETEMLAVHAVGEGENMQTVTSTLTTYVTTVTSTTTTTAVRKKCTRRKGSDASKVAPGVFSHLRPLVSEQETQRIRDGWTLSNAGDLTIGDLYIMFGEDMKLHLEYDWVWEEATLPRTFAPVHVKLCAAANEEQTNAAAPPMVCAEQNHRTDDAPNTNDTPAAEDGAYTGVDSCFGLKDEPCSEGMTNKDEINMIGKRLKQLLMLVNLGAKGGKKKCSCGNAVERKPKRNDCDNNLSTSQDDNMLFKQPVLPARIRVNYLTPEPHMSPQVRYKQSRWWRTRINRHQGHYPSLPAPRTPHSTTDTFSAIASDAISVPNTRESASRVPFPHANTSKVGKGNGSSSSLPIASCPDPSDSSLGVNRIERVLYEEENANDIGATARFALGSESNVSSSGIQTNPKSSNALSVGGFGAPAEVAKDDALSATTATFTTTVSHSTAIASAAPQNDDSCLSLFDLSLPSTSSSLMANIFSTSATESSADTSLLPRSPVDAKMLNTGLGDISLTSFFGQLDAVYQNDEAAHRQPVQSGNIFDLDISTMSEGSIDYIARFENIASELRAQGNP
uniref:Myb-like domain-containing protein n=1 Tax=Anopheles atroparvus TaxID=41427 RepID=A0A182IP58_ANOAO